MEKTYPLKSKEDTIRLAQKIAPLLKAGDVMALSGELGAGKTFFTQALCSALKVTDAVTSPTFVILNEYHGGEYPVFHFDLYRMESVYEVLDLGILDMVEEGITIIEWPELTGQIIPTKTWELSFHYNGRKRWVDVKGKEDILA